MSFTAIHHIEICVGDLQHETHKFLTKYGFRLIGRRSTKLCEQHVLRAGEEYFVLTQRKAAADYDEEWTVFCCQEHEKHSTDSVFNVALLVKSVSAATERARSVGAKVIKKPRYVEEHAGRIAYSVVKSCCGNVVHTLINKDGYGGWFLPGFEYLGTFGNGTASVWDRYANASFVDHVTYVCRSGESKDILEWYGNVFSMQRFIFNKRDDFEDGLILEAPVWMRLKAMEYWLCSDTAIAPLDSASNGQSAIPENNRPKGTIRKRGPQFILVIAESAYQDKSSIHLEDFIRDHQGPGIQHIAFSTPNIFGTVAVLTSQGVAFRRPPGAYYQELNTLSDIKSCGYMVESLKAHGILLDSEVDIESTENVEENGHLKTRHLMQIFTKGVFHPNTFFLEVIQRCGARGFGAGNISTLARCIEQQQKRQGECNKTVA